MRLERKEIYMKKANMVDINKDYVREKIKSGGFKYVDLARIMGKASKGTLTCAISAERMSLDDLKTLARIVDFPYDEALRSVKPKAYIKANTSNIKDELEQIVKMQKEINITLVGILKKYKEIR